MTTATLAPNAIKNRYDFVLLFDVTNGNPNGDPDAGNQPRIDAETGRGIVTDVCLKRKIRDFVTLVKTDRDNGSAEYGYRIYVQHHGVLERFHREAYEASGLKANEKNSEKRADNVLRTRTWMCETFYDIRTFGGVLSLKGSDTGEDASRYNCGQVRGPVQLTFATSIDPIMQDEFTIVRKAVATEKAATSQAEKHGQITGTMGNKHFVPYGLYQCHGFVSPHLAADTGFTDDDLDLLWQALTMMFEHDRSAARGEMATRKLVVFEHESPLGNAPAHSLFRRVNVERLDNSKPPRSFEDYSVRVDTSDLPSGITVDEKL